MNAIMSATPLAGKKVAVFVESEYIPEEIATYQSRFAELGAEVHVMSRLWGNPSIVFVSDADEIGKPVELLTVDRDFENTDPGDYAAVIMAANYVSVRLRYFESPDGVVDPANVTKSPAVQWFAKAMELPHVVKGILCHGLWILTPNPHLLKDRTVICHEVVLADILNAGANYHYDPSGVVVDGDLVTGRSKHEANLLVDTVTQRVVTMQEENISK